MMDIVVNKIRRAKAELEEVYDVISREGRPWGEGFVILEALFDDVDALF